MGATRAGGRLLHGGMAGVHGGTDGERWRAAVAALLLALLAAASWIAASDPARANHDVAWTLHAGEILLDGGAYGVDVIDNNPPFVYWLGAGVSALARALGAQALGVYALLVLAAAVLAAWLARRLLADGVLPPVWADATALVLLTCWALVPGPDTGQRDHLTIVLAMPYLLAAGRLVAGLETPARLRAACGVLAALGIALKPHYALLWICVEATVAVRLRSARRLLRVENVVIAGIGAAYLALVFAAVPDYLRGLDEVRRLHGAYDQPIDWLSPAHFLCLAALGALALLRLPPALGRVAQTLALASGVALFLLHAQAKDWPYHSVPALLSALSALVLVGAGLASLSDSLNERVRLGPRAAVALAMILWAAFAVVGLRQPLWSKAGVPALAEFIDGHARGGEVLAFTSTVNPFFPALNFTRSRSASPYSCLWLVVGHYSQEERALPRFPYRSLEEMPEGERRFVENVVGALERRRPALLLFDRPPVKLRLANGPLNYRRYFGAHPRFEALLGEYRQLESRRFFADGWRHYEVWLRRDG